MNKTPFNSQLAQSLTTVNGLKIAAAWLGSFVCTIYGFERPLLSSFGSFLGLFSMLLLTRMVRSCRAQAGELNWLNSLGFAFTICIYATLVTTLGQYLYFAYLDNGHLLNTLSALLQDPQYAAALKQTMPEMDPQTLMDTISNMKARDIIVQLLFTNTLISCICTPVGAFFGKLGTVNPPTENVSKE